MRFGTAEKLKASNATINRQFSGKPEMLAR